MKLLLHGEEAKKIAKEMDRKISILNIISCEAELDIERINSYIYIQEKTLGKEDENKEDIIDGIKNVYNGYSNEKILRNVWNVKIVYEYDDNKVRNNKEFFGRNYYVDATTGEIIGGSWGK